MTRVGRLGMSAAVLVGTVLAPAFAGSVTVGNFYTALAQAKHLGYADSVSAESSLRGAGFNLPALALDKSLTEGDLASIAGALGMSVTTSRPTEQVGESQMIKFVSSFGHQLTPSPAKGGDRPNPYATNSQSGDPGNSGNGKGKKKGHNKSVSEPL